MPPKANDLYTMYGAEFSMYSGKLRSYLRKKAIPFRELNSSLRRYKTFIIPRTGVRYIPVLQTPQDEVLQDTTVIIDFLEQRFLQTSVYPQTPARKLASLLLELFGDEWMVIPAMHYRWSYPEQNQPFIYGEFGRMAFPLLPGFMQTFIGKYTGELDYSKRTEYSLYRHNDELIDTNPNKTTRASLRA